MTSLSTPVSKQTPRLSPAARLRLGLQKHWLPYMLLLPLVALLIAFLAIPFISLFYYSLQRMDLGMGTTSTFVGFRNFEVLFREVRFGQNLLATLIYLGGVLLISVPMSYFAALLVSSGLRGIGAVRTLFLIPWVLAPVVTALLFRTLLDPQSGPVTAVLSAIMGRPFYLTLTEEGSRALIVFHSAWRSFPLQMLVIAAGMTAIPVELYDAAKVDGANLWHQFKSITFPLTRVALFSAVLVTSTFTIQDAEGVYALTQGGPGYGTEVTGVRLFKEAFLYFNIGFASSIGIALIGLCVVLMIVYNKILGQGEVA